MGTGGNVIIHRNTYRYRYVGTVHVGRAILRDDERSRKMPNAFENVFRTNRA